MNERKKLKNAPVSCLNWHFLKQCKTNTDGLLHDSEVTDKVRDKISCGANMEDILEKGHHLACAQGVWDSAEFRGNAAKDIPAIITGDRENECFFLNYIPYMSFTAAKKIERRLSIHLISAKDQAIIRACNTGVCVMIIAIVIAIIGALSGC